MLYFCSCTKTIFLVVVVVDIIPKNEKHLERATKALMKKKTIFNKQKNSAGFFNKVNTPNIWIEKMSVCLSSLNR